MSEIGKKPLTYEKYWKPYLRNLRSRLEAGATTYGDTSFERPIPQLIQEIQEELADVSGWALVMWGRLEEMKKALGQK